MADSLQSLITKDRAASRPWQSEAGAWVFNVGLVAFLASLVFLGGLFLYNRSLNSSRDVWKKQIDTQEADLRPDLLQQLIDLSNELAATKSLLSNHTFASNVFTFLEQSTHPKVQYTNFAFAADALKIDLSAVAASYQTVADEISILEANPQVAKVDFGGLSRTDQGLVNFRMSITVRPSLLKLHSQ